VSMVQAPAIGRLVDEGFTVIAAGGGGIPIVMEGSTLVGVDAVIDKDRAAAILAADLDADALVLVTGVDSVLLNFGTPDQREIPNASAQEMARHLADGQFPPGSMGPKVEASISYLERCDGSAIITSASLMAEALAGTAGTSITRTGNPT